MEIFTLYLPSKRAVCCPLFCLVDVRHGWGFGGKETQKGSDMGVLHFANDLDGKRKNV
jgi:hypothetical protein